MQPKPENSLATVTGGITLTVKKQDGTEESVRIRQVPVKQLETYLLCLDEELKLAEFVCDKPAGWSETLTLDSLEEIVVKSEELNSTDFFMRWVQRRIARTERMNPGMREKMMKSQLRNS